MHSTANLKQIVDWKKKFEHAILLIEKLADVMYKNGMLHAIHSIYVISPENVYMGRDIN